MKMLAVFTRRITSSRFDAGVGHAVCWAFAILVLVIGLPKLASLQLTEPQLFFGALLLVAVSLLGIILGTLVLMSHDIAGIRKAK